MKVFVVTVQTLTHDSSYYDVIAVCSTLEKAQAVLGTCESDFIKGLESDESLGIENLDFYTNSLSIKEEEMQLTITDECTGMFEKYIISIRDLH